MKRVQSFYTKLGVVAVGAAVAASNAAAAIAMPTVDYADINSAAALGFGIIVTVALLMKAKSFLRG